MGVRGCPIERAVRVLDGKWTLLVLRELFGGTRRFGELLAALPGASPKTLTDRLRGLEAAGILHREVYPEVPPRVEYSLTALGRSLGPVMDALRDWGESHPEHPGQHDAPGSAARGVAVRSAPGQV